MSVDVYRSEQRDPLRRGREIGWARRAQITRTARDYAWFFDAARVDDRTVRRVAEQCLDQLRDWAPPLAAEIEGIASGAGLDVWQAAALNARTEILVRGSIAGLNECSVAVWVPDGKPPRSFQTWDWVPWAADATVLGLRSEAALDVVTCTESGVVGKVGVNGAGVGVHFTLMCHTSDGSVPGVPVHAVARQVLDSATDLDSAIAVVQSAPVAASASLTLLHWDGVRARGATVEIAPAGSAVLAPDDDFLLHTNHFLDPALAAGDRLAAIDDDTLPRMTELRRRKQGLAADSLTARATEFTCHWEDGAPVCAHPRPDASETNRWETKMMFSLDLASPALVLHEGGPCGVTEAGWMVVAP
ncbi:MAG TPA: C45 family peptidase [Nocardioidaceae bacterium]|nr:C45 family peptidase [Nocardioidaceae bacterium]